MARWVATIYLMVSLSKSVCEKKKATSFWPSNQIERAKIQKCQAPQKHTHTRTHTHSRGMPDPIAPYKCHQFV